MSFGWQYEFGKSEITKVPDMPAFLLPVRTRAATLFSLDPNSLMQSAIVEYSTGVPIGWHRDIPQFGVVIGVSLGAACRMRFRKYTRGGLKNSNRAEILSIELRPRSIYLMSGASREDLAAFHSAAEGIALLDHDEDLARKGVRCCCLCWELIPYDAPVAGVSVVGIRYS